MSTRASGASGVCGGSAISWKVREAQIEARRAEQKRVLREIDLARKQWADAHPEEQPGCGDGAKWTPEPFTF